MSTTISVDYAANRIASRSKGLTLTPGKAEGYTTAIVVSEARARVEAGPEFGEVEVALPAYRHTPLVPFYVGEKLSVNVRVYNSGNQINVQFLHVESEYDPDGLGTNVDSYPVTVV